MRRVGWLELGALSSLVLAGAWTAGARAQDVDDEGLPAAPGEARTVVGKSLEAMGGAEAVGAVRAAAIAIEPAEGGPRERHSLRLEGRLFHYQSRHAGGTGFDIVLARDLAVLSDRGPEGQVTYVEDLAADDAREGGYERDVLFMPLLLPALLADARAQLDHRGKTTTGEDVVRALVHPPEGAAGEPYYLRLRFDPETRLLSGVMGAIPVGRDAGRKRYVTFLDWRPVGKLKLPHKFVDKRDKDAPPREVVIAWTLDPELPADLFTRPAAPAPRAE